MELESWQDVFKRFLETTGRMGEMTSGGTAVIKLSELGKWEKDVADAWLEGGATVLVAAEMAAKELCGSNVQVGKIVVTMEPGDYRHLPVGELWGEHVGKIVAVPATMSSKSKKAPHYETAVFVCQRCGAANRVKPKGIKKVHPPLECGGCKRPSSSTKFHLDEAACVRDDEQWLELSEMAGETPAGEETARTVDVRVIGRHLIEAGLVPGENLTVHGLFRELNEPDKVGAIKASPETFIDAYWIERNDKLRVKLSDEDRAKIEEFASSSDPIGKMARSIAPHIAGMLDVKRGLTVQMLGGVDKQLGTKKARGTIHGIMVGDPGTAKSDLMKSIYRIMPGAVYSTAPSSTRVGYTASLEQVTRFGKSQWVVKAGVLPKASGSVALLDEMGQASMEDFKALEECMELQQVTKTGAGKNVTLPANTTIIGAANPHGGGRWNEEEKILAQIGRMPLSTLTRFDLFYVIIDKTDHDQEVVDIISQHHGWGDMPPPPPMKEELLRKYISLAQSYNPILTDGAKTVIEGAYHDLRALPQTIFTPRHLEGMIRIAGAVARSRLSDKILEEHAIEAVDLHQAGWKPIIDERYGEGVNVDHVKMPHSQEERIRAVLALVSELEGVDGVPYSILQREATTRWKLTDLELRQSVDRLHDDGKLIEKRSGVWGTG